MEQRVNKGTKYGLAGGAVFGVFFATFFSLASWVVCSGNANCPGHWAPYLYVSLIALAVCATLGAFAGTVAVWFYNITKVS
ncbi:MAG: hypothetical protein EXR57_03975 [Dehalococcoidia bacterium]|nr:hypothetical protein [Dehalococcoidia bacterium]